MRAKLIGEDLSFERGQSPKKAMGIGKEGIRSRIQQFIGTANPDLVEEVISRMAEDKEGSFDEYLPEEKQEELYWIFKFLGKRNIKVKWISVDDDVPEKYRTKFIFSDSDILEYLYDKKIEPELKKGWEIFNSKYSYKSLEYILVKYP